MPQRKADAFRADKITNPFGAPFFYKEQTESTMLDAREITAHLVAAGALLADGTLALAGFQEQGRGRLAGRRWLSRPGENLVCTAIFNAPAPQPFTLRVGLAVAHTFDAFLPAGAERTRVKWPNDVLFRGKKLSGILCESDGRFVYAGTGLNVAQEDFPPEIREKASSLALILREAGKAPPPLAEVLEVFLVRLKAALDGSSPWEEELNAKLYRRGETVSFYPGTAQPGGTARTDGTEDGAVTGILRGIEKTGGLILETPDGPRTFYSGELRF